VLPYLLYELFIYDLSFCIQMFLLKERIKIVGDKGDKTIAREDYKGFILCIHFSRAILTVL